MGGSKWENRLLVDSTGVTIGKIEEVWPEQATGRLAWAMVRTNLGHQPAYLPASGMEEQGTGTVVVPYASKVVLTAPRIDLGSTLADVVSKSIIDHFLAARPPGPGSGDPRPSEPMKPPDD